MSAPDDQRREQLERLLDAAVKRHDLAEERGDVKAAHRYGTESRQLMKQLNRFEEEQPDPNTGQAFVRFIKNAQGGVALAELHLTDADGNETVEELPLPSRA